MAGRRRREKENLGPFPPSVDTRGLWWTDARPCSNFVQGAPYHSILGVCKGGEPAEQNDNTEIALFLFGRKKKEKKNTVLWYRLQGTNGVVPVYQTKAQPLRTQQH